MRIPSSRPLARVLALLLVAACARPDPPPPAPDWVAAVIAELEREPVGNPPASLTRYTYNGKTVYYVPPRCCDVAGVLYAESGDVLCGPDGGLTGRGDGRCPDFHATRSDEQLIWRDTRKPE